MADHDAEQAQTDSLIAELRGRLADGWCLCSSTHTDWQGVGALLDRLERAEAMHAEAFHIGIAKQDQLEAVQKYADRCSIMRTEPSTEGLRRALSSPPAKPTPGAPA